MALTAFLATASFGLIEPDYSGLEDSFVDRPIPVQISGYSTMDAEPVSAEMGNVSPMGYAGSNLEVEAQIPSREQSQARSLDPFTRQRRREWEPGIDVIRERNVPVTEVPFDPLVLSEPSQPAVEYHVLSLADTAIYLDTELPLGGTITRRNMVAPFGGDHQEYSFL